MLESHAYLLVVVGHEGGVRRGVLAGLDDDGGRGLVVVLGLRHQVLDVGGHGHLWFGLRYLVFRCDLYNVEVRADVKR